MAEDDDQEDRTEDPTQRRLEQAIERGDVARSMEVNTWFVLAGGTLAPDDRRRDAGRRRCASRCAASWPTRMPVPTDGAGADGATGRALLTGARGAIARAVRASVLWPGSPAAWCSTGRSSRSSR